MSKVKLNTTGGSGGSVALKGPASTTSNADVELTLPVDDGSADQYLKTDGSGALSWSTVSSVGGATGVDFNDSIKARFGTGNDLEIYHDGSNSRIVNATGEMQNFADTWRVVSNSGSNENMLRATYNSGIELFHDNALVLNTDAYGIEVSAPNTSNDSIVLINGAEGRSAQLRLQADEGDDNSDLWRFVADTDNKLKIQSYADGSWENCIHTSANGNVELYDNNIKRFETTSNGATIAGDLGDNGGGKTGKVYSNYWVHRHGQSGGVSQNESEAIFIYGGLHFFGDYITMSNSNFSHGLTGNRSYAMLAVHQEGSGAAIHAEDGAITEASDYRIKENVNPLGSGIDKVKALKPITYTLKKSWKPSGNGEIYHGFIAHEVDETLSGITGIVCGKKDAMAPELYSVKDEEEGRIPAGKKVMDETGNMTTDMDIQSVDYGKLTPIITAALKEAIAKIEILEAKVAALEAG